MKNLDREEQEEKYVDEGIDLMDYFRVIYKRKKGIAAIFLVIVIAAVIISLIIPPTFESNALLKIGLFRNKGIENIGDIQAVFSNDNTLKQIAQKLSLPPEIIIRTVADLFSIETDKELKSGFLTVKGWGNTPEEARRVVSGVIEALLERHQRIFNEMQKLFDMEVELLRRDQEKTAKDIEITEKEIASLDGDIKHYQEEIERRANVQSEAQGRIAESYIALLASAKSQKENKINELLNLKQKLANFDAAFQQKEFEKAYETKMTSVEAEPILPETKIAPARRKNVTIAGILGIFLGILYAFGAEYISRNKLLNS